MELFIALRIFFIKQSFSIRKKLFQNRLTIKIEKIENRLNGL
mgnify:CR=1 FL=1